MRVLATDYNGVAQGYDGTAGVWLQSGSYTGYVDGVPDCLPQESNRMKVSVWP